MSHENPHWTDSINEHVFMWFERYLGLFVLTIIFLFFVVVVAAGIRSASPSFSLNKDDWACTQAKSEMVMVGKVLIPENVCIQYTRR